MDAQGCRPDRQQEPFPWTSNSNLIRANELVSLAGLCDNYENIYRNTNRTGRRRTFTATKALISPTTGQSRAVQQFLPQQIEQLISGHKLCKLQFALTHSSQHNTLPTSEKARKRSNICLSHPPVSAEPAIAWQGDVAAGSPSQEPRGPGTAGFPLQLVPVPLPGSKVWTEWQHLFPLPVAVQASILWTNQEGNDITSNGEGKEHAPHFEKGTALITVHH